MNTHSHRGFTVIELMVTLVVAAVLLTLGVPSFSNTIEQNRLSTQINNLISTLQYARSESVKTGKRITVCKSNTGTGCVTTAAGYESGWIVFEDDSPADGDFDVGEQLLKVHEAMDSNLTLRGNNRFVNFISYLPTGGIANADPNADQDHFVLCKESDTTKSRAVYVITSGRARVAKDNNNDNIPEDDSGTNITTCTPA
jgi:type IV fimbrial biogenesis protein FimT